MGKATMVQIVAVAVAPLLILALARIYAAAILPVLRNRRLGRRGVNYEPAYPREGGNLFGLFLKLAPAIAVLAILAAIVIPVYQDYAARAHDKQRVAAINQIQNALDGYYLDHGTYPVSQTETVDAPGFAAALDVLVSGGYMTALPNDPGAGTYVYQSTADGTYYCLGANLEGTPRASTCDTATLGAALDANYAVGP